MDRGGMQAFLASTVRSPPIFLEVPSSTIFLEVPCFDCDASGVGHWDHSSVHCSEHCSVLALRTPAGKDVCFDTVHRTCTIVWPDA